MNWQEVEHAGLGCSPVALDLIAPDRLPLVFAWPEAELPETRDYMAALSAQGVECRIESPPDSAASGERLRELRGGVRCPVIGIWGRGTGATTLVWQLARHWQEAGRRAGALDLNVRRPGLFQVAGLSGRPAALGRAIVPRAKDGVRLLSLAAFLPAERPLVARGPDLERMCTTFRDDALWAGLDVLLVDLPDLPEVAAMQSALFSVAQTVRLLGPLEVGGEDAAERGDVLLRLGTDLPLDQELAAGHPPGVAYRQALDSLSTRLSQSLRPV